MFVSLLMSLCGFVAMCSHKGLNESRDKSDPSPSFLSEDVLWEGLASGLNQGLCLCSHFSAEG